KNILDNGGLVNVYTGLGQECIMIGEKRMAFRRGGSYIDIKIGDNFDRDVLMKIAHKVDRYFIEKQASGSGWIIDYPGLVFFDNTTSSSDRISHRYVISDVSLKEQSGVSALD